MLEMQDEKARNISVGRQKMLGERISCYQLDMCVPTPKLQLLGRKHADFRDLANIRWDQILA